MILTLGTSRSALSSAASQQVDDRVPVPEVGADLRLVHQGVPDEVRVPGPHRDLLCDPTPEAGAVHVARVLVQPADEGGVCGADAEQALGDAWVPYDMVGSSSGAVRAGRVHTRCADVSRRH
ncbi:hypothetical protein DN051_37760 [Streptomyces cadmiisoli]|uniref:Uncharacterized protein n=1 Tax=Streptomyces cadmiisoli TaxID=2184053 RepID=A0A2Z4J9T1_9ACTN|nr:hypothetical protein DN051_37760 [Streptomyces cadmiisoli]